MGSAGTGSEKVRLISREINFQELKSTRSRFLNVTDRQTDRRTDGRTDNLPWQHHALRASRGKTPCAKAANASNVRQTSRPRSSVFRSGRNYAESSQLDHVDHQSVSSKLWVWRQKKPESRRCCAEHVEQTVDDVWQMADGDDRELQKQRSSHRLLSSCYRGRF